ncbi:hypothetical protein NMH_2452 [Neisseria meningitidis H44/76]|uniref:PilS cassette n=1 Tax=Neisseria meningitidis serogroup B / serotype 15 (strain H44/76) TaxID=909420 RepID=E6N0R7_NEIMH|nr:hypothetical protein NMH_2452 [Neisseria meningitidis H44/76]
MLFLVFCPCGNDEILSFRNLSKKQKPLRRHSRAGGNPASSVRKLIGKTVS